MNHDTKKKTPDVLQHAEGRKSNTQVKEQDVSKHTEPRTIYQIRLSDSVISVSGGAADLCCSVREARNLAAILNGLADIAEEWA